jgi:hypothetical protein
MSGADVAQVGAFFVIISRYCIQKIAFIASEDVLIPSTTLTHFMDLETREQEFRNRALQLLLDIRAKRRRIQARDRRLAAHRQRRQKAREKEIYLEAKIKGSRAALEWLVDEQQWQKDVLSASMNKACALLGQHLAAQRPEIPWQEVLLAQLPEILKQAGDQQCLVLRVPVGMVEMLKGHLLGYSLVLEGLPEGETGFAWVESATARVRIPLEEQLDTLLHCLSLGGRQDGRC